MSHSDHARSVGSGAAVRPDVNAAFAGYDDLRAEDLAFLRAELVQSLDRLEARGPLSFDFGADHWGTIAGLDLACQEGREFEATGRVEVPTYVDLFSWEVSHPTPELLRTNPIAAIGDISVLGGDDQTLAALACHRDLRTVSLHCCITEADVSQALARCEEELESYRRELQLEGLPIDDLELRPPAHRVGGTPLTDHGLRALTGHPSVSYLSLRGTHVSDEALGEVLATLPCLDTLEVESNALTGSFLSHLGDTSLTKIVVTSPALSGPAINPLPVLGSVEWLHLAGPNVRDGLDAAALATALPGLQTLNLGLGEQGDAVSDDVLAFVLAFPDTKINGLRMSSKAIAKWAAKHQLSPVTPAH